MVAILQNGQWKYPIPNKSPIHTQSFHDSLEKPQEVLSSLRWLIVCMQLPPIACMVMEDREQLQASPVPRHALPAW